MGRPLLKVTDPATGEKLACIWSTVADAPLTCFVPLEWFVSSYREWLKERAIEEAEREYENFLDNLKRGRAFHMTQGEAVRGNRAGENDKRLSLKELIEEYRAE